MERKMDKTGRMDRWEERKRGREGHTEGWTLEREDRWEEEEGRTGGRGQTGVQGQQDGCCGGHGGLQAVPLSPLPPRWWP